jgi:hypothetical protein
MPNSAKYRSLLDGAKSAAELLVAAAAKAEKAAGMARNAAAVALKTRPMQKSGTCANWAKKMAWWAAAAAASADATGDAGKAVLALLDKALAAQDPAKQLNLALTKTAQASNQAAQTVSQASSAKQWADMAASKDVIKADRAARSAIGSVADGAASARAWAASSVNKATSLRRYLSLALAEWQTEPEPPEPPVPVEPIEPLADVVMPDMAGFAVAFDINRSQPWDEACAVNWSISGDVGPDDFMPGTVLAGTVAWQAGDGTDRHIELVLNPGAKPEPDEVAVATLSGPQNCVLDEVTSATFLIKGAAMG